MKFQQIRSATSIVEFGGSRFLIDPMLAPAGSYPAVPETTSTGRGNPDCELPCPMEALFAVDAVIATHLHFDHFDEWAATYLPKSLPIFSQSAQEAAELRSFGFGDVRVLSEAGTRFADVTLYRTECDHGRSNAATRLFYQTAGYSDRASGVVFEAQNEPRRLYLAGDSIYGEEVQAAMRRFAPGVVAVNAAGAQFPRGHLLIMNEYDIFALMHDYPGVDVVATHVEGVSHATVTRASLRRFKAEKALERLAVPEDGETLEY